MRLKYEDVHKMSRQRVTTLTNGTNINSVVRYAL